MKEYILRFSKGGPDASRALLPEEMDPEHRCILGSKRFYVPIGGREKPALLLCDKEELCRWQGELAALNKPQLTRILGMMTQALVPSMRSIRLNRRLMVFAGITGCARLIFREDGSVRLSPLDEGQDLNGETEKGEGAP